MHSHDAGRRPGLLRPSPRRAVAPATLLVAAAALGALGACDSRFPVCKTDGDCKVKVEPGQKPDPKAHDKLCFDLRCVECRYDSDCKDGEVCATQTRECKKLDSGAPAATVAPGEPGSGTTPGAPRDPVAWEACVKKCNDKDCIAKCDAQFE
jgi:Cys-rich repeat protein